MANPRPLLDRLLNVPDLATVVPRLRPDVLHRVIQTCGLEACTEFVALATPEQLTRVLDLDVWRLRAVGADETFDADRFGEWIAVLLDAGADVAFAKLEGLDVHLIVTGLASHIRVFDHVAVSSYITLDGELVQGRTSTNAFVSEIGGFHIEAKRTSAWDVIVELLAFLDAEHPAYFRRVMRACVRLSSGPREADGFHDLLEEADQDLFDLARTREARREGQGYVSPAQAHAFLRGARDVRLDGHRPPPSPIARAHFRAVESALTDPDAGREASTEAGDPGATAPSEHLHDQAGTVDVLRDAGLLGAQPRALLGAPDQQPSRLMLIHAHLSSRPAGVEELAYLANAVMAGGSLQGRPFTMLEASDAGVAICNLGLESWPSSWDEPDLVTAFQVGWAILHRDVCLHAARTLIRVLDTIHCGDRDIQLRLEGLRRDLMQHIRAGEPWRARDNLDVIITMDAPAWAVLVSLIDECPVMHAALAASRQRVLTINPSEFTFISERSQIRIVDRYLATLATVLTR
jgi:hypothetical protein